VVTMTLGQATGWRPRHSVRWLGGDYDTLSGDWVVTMTLIRWPPVIWEYNIANVSSHNYSHCY